jgi:hypothetical protein
MERPQRRLFSMVYRKLHQFLTNFRSHEYSCAFSIVLMDGSVEFSVFHHLDNGEARQKTIRFDIESQLYRP